MPDGPVSDGKAAPLRVEHTTRKLLRVPRSAWWLLAGAGVLLLVFGFLRPQFFTKPPAGAPFQVPAERHFVKTFDALGRSDGVWLTSDSPSAVFDVTLPVDVTRERDRVKLAGSSQVAEDATVFLQVLLDGQQVYERELPRGRRNLDETVEIPESVSADGQVRVTARIRGTLSHPRCSPDQAAGAVVHLDQNSVVEAELDRPLHTVRDVVAALDHDVTLVVTDTGDEWFATAMALGMALLRAGHEVHYTSELPADVGPSAILVGPAQTLADRLGWQASEETDDASVRVGAVGPIPRLGVVSPEAEIVSRLITTPAAATADGSADDPGTISTTMLAGNQVSLQALGADLAETTITDQRSWRVDYSLADLPGGRVPATLIVGMSLPATPADLAWILTTSLNGQMIDSRRLTNVPTSIPLPLTAQRVDNRLTLTVQRDRDLGGCEVRVTPYPMQLLPVSALVLGDVPAAGFAGLPAPLSGDTEVWVEPGADRITALNAAVGVVAEFTPWGRYPVVRSDAGGPPDSPHIMIGAPPSTALLQLQDDRLIAGSAPELDLRTLGTGIVVQCNGPGAPPGLAVSVFGQPGRPVLGQFGSECAQVVTPAGSFAVVGQGDIYVPAPVRKGPG